MSKWMIEAFVHLSVAETVALSAILATALTIAWLKHK
jgi:hypothetical protein